MPVTLELTIMVVTGVKYHYSSYTLTIEGDALSTEPPSPSPDDDDGSSASSVFASASQVTIFSALATTSMAVSSIF
jgi:hypothetical protein